jgi:tetratricopeptide (TPR) repeat protein
MVAKVKRSMFVFVVLMAYGHTSAQTITDIVEKASKSVVMIISYDSAGYSLGQGSGVFVSNDGRALTNAHVLKGAYSAEVLTSFADFTEVQVLYIDDKRDLALIRVLTNQSTPIDLPDNTDFKAGQRVIAIGNPLGFEKTVSDGLISGIRWTKDGIELIQTSVPISPGSSGGVLLNELGQLIGITTLSIRTGQNINFAISINTIGEFAKDYDQADPQKTNFIQLKQAKASIWYKVVFHWVGRVFGLLLALIFGSTFYYVIPILMTAVYIVYLLIKGAVWVIQYPFRYAKKKKEILINKIPKAYPAAKSRTTHDLAPVLVSEGKEDSAGGMVFEKQALAEDELVEQMQSPDEADIRDFSVSDWISIGTANWEGRHYAEALLAFEKTIEIDPSYYNAWINKAMCLSSLGRAGEAIEACNRAIKIYPSHPRAWNDLGFYLGKLGRNNEALDAFNKSLELDKMNIAGWCGKGRIHFVQGDYIESIQAFNEALYINPRYAFAWRYKGCCLGELGRYREAYEAFDKAIEISPAVADYCFCKAFYLAKLGRFSKALEAINEAIRFDSSSVVYWSEKGRYLHNLGKLQEAQDAFARMNELKRVTNE